MTYSSVGFEVVSVFGLYVCSLIWMNHTAECQGMGKYKFDNTAVNVVKISLRSKSSSYL